MDSSIKNISEILKTSKNLFSTSFSTGYNFDEKQASDFFDDLISLNWL